MKSLSLRLYCLVVPFLSGIAHAEPVKFSRDVLPVTTATQQKSTESEAVCCKTTIWRMKTDGLQAISLSGSHEMDSGAVCSPDGKWLAFSVRDAETLSSNLWIMQTDGSNRQQLTKLDIKNQTVFALPSWSPDSRNIVFAVQNRPKASNLVSHIYAIAINGKNLRNLGEGYSPVWSPDGKKIAFNSQDNHRLSVMNGDGSQRTFLGESKEFIAQFGAVWSPNSQRLAFTHTYATTPPNGPSIVSLHFLLCIVDLDGKNLQKLGEGHMAVWSPDGRQLAYVGNSFTNLYVSEANGNNPKLLHSGDTFQPTWSPDSRQVAYSTLVGKSHIFALKSDGSNLRQLTTDKGGDGGPQYSGDGRYIFFTRAWGFFTQHAEKPLKSPALKKGD